MLRVRKIHFIWSCFEHIHIHLSKITLFKDFNHIDNTRIPGVMKMNVYIYYVSGWNYCTQVFFGLLNKKHNITQ